MAGVVHMPKSSTAAPAREMPSAVAREQRRAAEAAVPSQRNGDLRRRLARLLRHITRKGHAQALCHMGRQQRRVLPQRRAPHVRSRS